VASAGDIELGLIGASAGRRQRQVRGNRHIAEGRRVGGLCGGEAEREYRTRRLGRANRDFSRRVQGRLNGRLSGRFVVVGIPRQAVGVPHGTVDLCIRRGQRQELALLHQDVRKDLLDLSFDTGVLATSDGEIAHHRNLRGGHRPGDCRQTTTAGRGVRRTQTGEKFFDRE
jgi:hypothetical protein